MDQDVFYSFLSFLWAVTISTRMQTTMGTTSFEVVIYLCNDTITRENTIGNKELNITAVKFIWNAPSQTVPLKSILNYCLMYASVFLASNFYLNYLHESLVRERNHYVR